MMLPSTKLVLAELKSATPRTFPEIKLPAPGAVPPMMLFCAALPSTQTPAPKFPIPFVV